MRVAVSLLPRRKAGNCSSSSANAGSKSFALRRQRTNKPSFAAVASCLGHTSSNPQSFSSIVVPAQLTCSQAVTRSFSTVEALEQSLFKFSPEVNDLVEFFDNGVRTCGWVVKKEGNADTLFLVQKPNGRQAFVLSRQLTFKFPFTYEAPSSSSSSAPPSPPAFNRFAPSPSSPTPPSSSSVSTTTASTSADAIDQLASVLAAPNKQSNTSYATKSGNRFGGNYNNSANNSSNSNYNNNPYNNQPRGTSFDNIMANNAATMPPYMQAFTDVFKFIDEATKMSLDKTTRELMEQFWSMHIADREVTAPQLAQFIFRTATPSTLQVYAAFLLFHENCHVFFRHKEGGRFECRNKEQVTRLKAQRALLGNPAAVDAFVARAQKKLLEETSSSVQWSATSTTTSASTLNNSSNQQQQQQPIQSVLADLVSKTYGTNSTTANSNIDAEPNFDLSSSHADFVSLLKRYAFTDLQRETLDKEVSSKILKPLGFMGRNSDAHKLLVTLGELNNQDNLHRLKHEAETNLFSPFPQHVIDSAGPLINIEAREDVGRRHHFEEVFTIDSEDTVEVDDGISIEDDGWIHIHIADPARLFAPHSEIDLAARSRSSSIYLPEIKAALFPHDLSAGIMSIKAGEKNYALTFSAKLDPQTGRITDYAIRPTILSHINRTNYIDVDKLLDHSLGPDPHYKIMYDFGDTEQLEKEQQVAAAAAAASISHPFKEKQSESLLKLWALASLRRKFRESLGAQLVNLPRPIFVLHDTASNTKRIELKSVKETRANILVGELMILANEVAATYSMKYNLPVPFRVQLPPSTDSNSNTNNSSDNSKATVEDDSNLHPVVLAWNKIKKSTPASYSAIPVRHHGVGLFYTRATSPIRRYADIVAHFQMKAQLKGESLPFSEKQMTELLPHVHERELEIKALQRNSERFWVFQYLLQQGANAEYNAIVLQMKKREDGSHFADVFMVDIGMKVPVRLFSPLPVGAKLKVRVARVDSYGLQIVPASILDFMPPATSPTIATPTATASAPFASAPPKAPTLNTPPTAARPVPFTSATTQPSSSAKTTTATKTATSSTPPATKSATNGTSSSTTKTSPSSTTKTTSTKTTSTATKATPNNNTTSSTATKTSTTPSKGTPTAAASSTKKKTSTTTAKSTGK